MQTNDAEDGDRLDGHPTTAWHTIADGRVQCDVCPRHCRMRPGQRGFCFVRGAASDPGGGVVLTTYGRSTGFCIDPIEKKPLNHFLPGTPVLSFGTAGCNLGCKFCQNWDISKSREIDRLSATASPDDIASAAATHGCRSVAFTYNDPVIWAEYAIDTAYACRDQGIHAVAVTAGYVAEPTRSKFFAPLSAVNVDLKAFTETFYSSLCFAALAPVLDTLAWIHQETDVWLEVTTLLIPGHNDSDAELHALSAWFAEHLGPDVPLHFSAFHPDYRMQDVPRTPVATLRHAQQIARSYGLRYVYTGNVHDPEGDATRCPGCQAVVIQRSWYTLLRWGLDAEGRCQSCLTQVSGVFEAAPGTWGSRRQPIRIHPAPHAVE